MFRDLDVFLSFFKLLKDDDFAFDNEVGKRNTQKASAENQNILERKEVLAGKDALLTS